MLAAKPKANAKASWAPAKMSLTSVAKPCALADRKFAPNAKNSCNRNPCAKMCNSRRMVARDPVKEESNATAARNRKILANKVSMPPWHKPKATGDPAETKFELICFTSNTCPFLSFC